MLKIYKSKNNKKDKIQNSFSLKSEVLIVNEEGFPAAINMDYAFEGDHPYIKVDKMGNSLQLITPFSTSVEEVYNFFINIYDILALKIKDYYIWPEASFQLRYIREDGEEEINFNGNPKVKGGITLEGLKKIISLGPIKDGENKLSIEKYMELAKGYRKAAFKDRFKLLGHENLELSTQILIKEAIKEGIEVKVIDEGENFIALKRGTQVEYVKEATKTSKDSYISVLIMENKLVTKKVLEEKNIRVPLGSEYISKEEALLEVRDLVNRPLVVKPKSTNFGIGISIFPEGAVARDIEKALEIAFEKDNTVLVEEFLSGKEFRFLVINDKVVGVLNRVPANVIGDGEKSIKELVEEKNKNPLRGRGYKTPLEKIILDESVKLFLKQRGKTINSIPDKNEVIYLRENSNISTGGDSIDYTEEMPERYKKIAIEAARAVKAKICGVDMMIKNIKEPQGEYGIIELNFNPAIHIHSYPYIGKERNIAKEILKLLDLK